MWAMIVREVEQKGVKVSVVANNQFIHAKNT
jgi:hypothetical protein